MSSEVPLGGIRFAQWPIYVFLGTIVNVCVVALFAVATLGRTKRRALVLGLIGAAFLIVLYGPFWFFGAGLINVYFSEFGQFDGPYFVPLMTASMLSVMSVVMTLGFAAAALRAERPTQPT
ncbi:MAG TPA: hypothetical protein VNF26_01980 [Candidatus Baltobacterales bacterium]|nr:hypothetical protein [Candidatus Baltobacterales bacterium]